MQSILDSQNLQPMENNIFSKLAKEKGGTTLKNAKNNFGISKALCKNENIYQGIGISSLPDANNKTLGVTISSAL